MLLTRLWSRQVRIFYLLAVMPFFFSFNYGVAAEIQTPPQVLDLQQSASQCVAGEDIAGALDKYKAIVQTSPGTIYASDALAEMGVLCVSNGDDAGAADALTQLCACKAAQPGAVRAVDRIAQGYISKRNIVKAQVIYTTAIRQMPEHSNRGRLQAGVVRCRILAKDLSQAQVALDQLWSKYQSDGDFVDYLRTIKDAYWTVGERAAHQTVCERAVEAFPDDPLAPDLLRHAIRGYIFFNDKVAAQSKYDQLWSKYRSDEHFVDYLRTIKDAYWEIGDRESHQTVCEQAVAAFPDDPLVPGLLKDDIRGYIFLDDKAAAQSKYDQLWSKYRSDEHFVDYLRMIKDAYWEVGDRAAHQAVCERAVEAFPNDPQAPVMLDALLGGYVSMGNMAAFDRRIDTLFSKYQEPADLFLRSVGHIQRCCREQNDDSLAIEIGNRALAINSSPENAIWVYQELALSYLDLGIENEADAVFNKMFELFADHPAFSQIINSIADTCRDKKNYSKSIDLYLRILAQNPVAERELEALSGIARASVHMDQTATSLKYPKVDTIVQTLMTDYRNVERLGFHVFMIGEEYYLRGDDALSKKQVESARSFYSKAFAIWQNNIDRIEDSRHRCLAYYYSGVACQHMGDYEEATEYYQKVVDAYPDFDKAWYALYSLTKCYDKLAEQEILEQSVAEHLKQTAYKELLRKYPNCAVAETVRKKIEDAG